MLTKCVNVGLRNRHVLIYFQPSGRRVDERQSTHAYLHVFWKAKLFPGNSINVGPRWRRVCRVHDESQLLRNRINREQRSRQGTDATRLFVAPCLSTFGFSKRVKHVLPSFHSSGAINRQVILLSVECYQTPCCAIERFTGDRFVVTPVCQCAMPTPCGSRQSLAHGFKGVDHRSCL
jgi:hypothetical protein